MTTTKFIAIAYNSITVGEAGSAEVIGVFKTRAAAERAAGERQRSEAAAWNDHIEVVVEERRHSR